MSAADPTSAAASTGLDEMGPVAYLVLEFTDGDRGIIRIVDLEPVRIEPAGTQVRAGHRKPWPGSGTGAVGVRRRRITVQALPLDAAETAG